MAKLTPETEATHPVASFPLEVPAPRAAEPRRSATCVGRIDRGVSDAPRRRQPSSGRLDEARRPVIRIATLYPHVIRLIRSVRSNAVPSTISRRQRK
jgi:hypothetical protein